MKKILIFSDTHGDINRCLDIIEKADSVSAIFHAGDYTGDAEDLESIYPNIPIYYVKGNNDYFSKAPSHMLVGGIKNESASGKKTTEYRNAPSTVC